MAMLLETKVLTKPKFMLTEEKVKSMKPYVMKNQRKIINVMQMNSENKLPEIRQSSNLTEQYEIVV